MLYNALCGAVKYYLRGYGFIVENMTMDKKYNDSLKFWNSAFDMDDKAKEEYTEKINPETDWRNLASSDKLADIIINNLSDKKRVLDYGCGEGWAGIILKKSGCEEVTCVDVAENAVKLASFFRDIFKISEEFTAQCVSTDWIEKSPEAVFDGLFCCNVIDVVPEEAAENIIKNMARITTDDAVILIGMNYYIEPISCPEKNVEVRNKNELYVNGVLRMVSRTDDEWKKIFERYFNIDSVEYYAWPGEKEEKRRVFCLSRKTD